MEQQEVAEIAVKITQIIKLNLHAKPQEVIQNVLEQIPGLSTDDAIFIFTNMGHALGYTFEDVENLIAQIQEKALLVESDIEHNSLFQTIAQALYVVALTLKNILPPSWRTVVTVILDVYEQLFK